MRKQPIRLTTRDRALLEKFSSKGTHNVRLVDRAKIILALDISGGREPGPREDIAERLGVRRRESAWHKIFIALQMKPPPYIA